MPWHAGSWRPAPLVGVCLQPPTVWRFAHAHLSGDRSLFLSYWHLEGHYHYYMGALLSLICTYHSLPWLRKQSFQMLFYQCVSFDGNILLPIITNLIIALPLMPQNNIFPPHTLGAEFNNILYNMCFLRIVGGLTRHGSTTCPDMWMTEICISFVACEVLRFYCGLRLRWLRGLLLLLLSCTEESWSLVTSTGGCMLLCCKIKIILSDHAFVS